MNTVRNEELFVCALRKGFLNIYALCALNIFTLNSTLLLNGDNKITGVYKMEQTTTFEIKATYDDLKQENMKLRHEVYLRELKIKRLENALSLVCKQWLKG